MAEIPQTQEEFRRNYECLRRMFEHAGDAIFIHGLDGRFKNFSFEQWQAGQVWGIVDSDEGRRPTRSRSETNLESHHEIDLTPIHHRCRLRLLH